MGVERHAAPAVSPIFGAVPSVMSEFAFLGYGVESPELFARANVEPEDILAESCQH